jgi:hypothetical protein
VVDAAALESDGVKSCHDSAMNARVTGDAFVAGRYGADELPRSGPKSSLP